MEKAGADLSRLVIGHLDRTLFSIKEMIELAETGCVLEFDLFGLEFRPVPVLNGSATDGAPAPSSGRRCAG